MSGLYTESDNVGTDYRVHRFLCLAYTNVDTTVEISALRRTVSRWR